MEISFPPPQFRSEPDADDSHKQWLLRARYYDASGSYISQETAASGGPDSLTKTWQRKGDVVTTDGKSLTEKR